MHFVGDMTICYQKAQLLMTPELFNILFLLSLYLRVSWFFSSRASYLLISTHWLLTALFQIFFQILFYNSQGNLLPFFPFVVVLFYFVSNQWHFKCLYSGVNKQLQWLIRLRRREENLNRRGHLQWVRKYGFFSRADVSVSKSIDRAGGGNTGEQWYRLLGRRKTIRVACEWET